jgi:hypothetical protein
MVSITVHLNCIRSLYLHPSERWGNLSLRHTLIICIIIRSRSKHFERRGMNELMNIFFIEFRNNSTNIWMLSQGVNMLKNSNDKVFTPLRLYSISSQIEANRNEYYEILEATQKNDLDIGYHSLDYLVFSTS